ncbi:restriction endonuclease [Flaviramulus sp. BrNp1-15]|uniref:DpnI domain-containing protein n=1 Tax=Flaviramulus sp. BrNp1-15 TaxID=2916754 RepID=UPI001EE9912A|nr:DpnI domain-containing protein [Flaviramulus sp. BrNp1-15]ULC58666.1 restriction endonuclease [Flaviramulus sp. BrNp1-15]
MDLSFNITSTNDYISNSQIARVLTEDWVKNNSYCPNCGEISLIEYENNKPVADFYCNSCLEQFELKSKRGIKVGSKIVDGAYNTMIKRINSIQNPNFFFLTYDKTKWKVNNFMIIPKHYFISDIIEKRKPLSDNARRAGWVGCNIDLKKIPENGRIFLVKNSEIISKVKVQSKWKRTEFLKTKKVNSKGWILDIMNCVDAIKNDSFTLNDIYKFENQLKLKYPGNNFIRDKIRQQLQLLRDKGLIEFKSRGIYKKITL